MNKKTYINIVISIGIILVAYFTFFSGVGLRSDEDKAFYTLGTEMGKSLQLMQLSKREVEIIAMGLKDRALNRNLSVNPEEHIAKLRELTQARQNIVAKKENEAGDDYLKQIEGQSGFVKKPSGLIFKEITEGKGKSPTTKDFVKVHYEGKFRDGSVFDSSIKRGQPARFAVTGVIPCWTEALQMMKVGSKAEIYCPANIAYGERGSPPVVPGGAMLAFQLELLSIEKK
jgi:FKBP-type peptidyl-prolyl cis-trans isomerase FkpA